MNESLRFATIGAAFLVVMTAISAQAQQVKPKPATEATRAANAAVLAALPFHDQRDFESAKRGFIAAIDGGKIRDAKGRVVWDLGQFDFVDRAVDAPAPDTVNPSLWRMTKLLMNHGLYEVVDGQIYQVRGYDLSTMSIIRGKTGWILIDPLLSAETGAAALALVNKHLGRRTVKAVIFTHSHIDHYGGIRGVVDEADVKSGKVRIIAGEGFLESSVSENVIAGNVMSRRAAYMYGNLLPKASDGMVGAGLGITTSTGTPGILPETDTITHTGQSLTVDGIEMEFLMAPHSEAPVEILTYFPAFKAFISAEDCTHTLHNLYTLRGARTRDGLKWSKYLQEVLDLWGDKTDVMFASHHWPTWGNTEVRALLAKQRDLYRYIHDQTLRLANHGLTPREIAEEIELPRSLANTWANRGYYGTVSHNVRAQYDLYLGFFDGNPSNLHKLPPVEGGKRYVEFMGGADAVVKKAQGYYNKGEFRWVAEVLNHVVFASPEHAAAKSLLADTYEQLGYQAESGPWRNFYLTGAKELRVGVKVLPTPNTASPDTVRAMALDTFFDFLGVRLNGPKAEGKKIALNFEFTDTGQKYALGVENGALHYSKGRLHAKPDARLALPRTSLNDIILGLYTLEDKISAGEIRVDGNRTAVDEFVSLLDNFELWFNIVTP
ncbi:MAG: MBL fold metallo-hydrolase [Planctomycetota bacterium]|nr:MBL fold metallo-hydrolase [Planctomycetota bacterium]